VADEPDNIVLIRLAEIRATQEDHTRLLKEHSREMREMRDEMADLNREMAYAMGLGTRSIVKHKEQDARLNELVTKVEELLSRTPSGPNA
jgi:phage shock protein A